MLSALLRMSFVTLAIAIARGLVPTAAYADPEPWVEIRESLFASRPIADDGSVKIFAPKRAEDAALVPIRVFITAERIPTARQLILIVDHNPAPVAAVFHFADLYRAGGDIGDRSLEVRVRLENMSRVRAILETKDGQLYEASQFVAGAGGCTSTSLKDMDEAMRDLGKIRLKVEKDTTRGNLWRELQVAVRHPNFSGMQIDTRTNAYTPAEFVDRIEVDVGAARLVTIESGIAISEDPNFRLTFAKQDPVAVTLVVRDTESRLFRAHVE